LIKKYAKKAEAPIVKPEKIIPPYVVAMQELNRIKNEKIWQQARIKEYYTDLTTVLRQYIEKQYEFSALEMTSDEILSTCNGIRTIDKKSLTSLQQILKLSDLVKFAKWVPTILEHETMLNNAYEFIDSTKQELKDKDEKDVKQDELSVK
jgi:hypothetical protein